MSADQEVDDFGRNVPVRKNRNSHHEDRDQRGDRMRDYRDNRGDRRSNDYHNNRGDFSRNNKRNSWHSGDRQSRGDYSGHRHHDNRRNDNFQRQLPPMRPMMSFKKFITQQKDDVSMDLYQQKYEEYQVQYTIDFSNHFYDSNKKEEWFGERYDPFKIQQQEKETCAWACGESMAFNVALHEGSCEDFVKGCRLEPAVAAPPTLAPGLAVAPAAATTDIAPALFDASTESASAASGDQSEAAAMQEADGNSTTEDAVESSVEGVVVAETRGASAGRSLPGHDNCCLAIVGIPPNCPKLVFKAIIMELIPVELIDRVIISQPCWKDQNRFERSAWIIMCTHEAANEYLPKIRDHKFMVPGLIDVASGEANICLFDFSVQVNWHSSAPVAANALHPGVSAPGRISADEHCAKSLADVLDEDRGVPAEYRLQATLEQYQELLNNALTAGSTHVTYPGDILDISIAYLRRVHFLAYYHGRRFHDEAHLLTFAPDVCCRSIACVPVASGLLVATSTANTGDVAEVDEDVNTSHKRKRGDSIVDEEDEANEDPNKTADIDITTAENDQPMDTTEAADGNASSEPVAVVAPGSRPNANKKQLLSLVDKRLELLLIDLQARQHVRRNADSDAIPINAIENDARTIAMEQEAAIAKWTDDNYRSEGTSGKARCPFKWCSKLFKSAEFLRKHLKSKHSDLPVVRDLLQQVSDPFMKVRYENEDILSRPLPLMEVELLHTHTVERKSVKEVLDICKNASNIGLVYSSGGGSGGDGLPMLPINAMGLAIGSGRVSGGNDFRHFRGDNRPPPPPPRGPSEVAPGLGGGGGGSNYRQHDRPHHSQEEIEKYSKRTLSNYLDVDAPTAEVAVKMDYGVALLTPAKKRKLVVKPKKTPTPAEVVGAVDP